MPYSTIVSNPRKLLRGEFETSNFVVPFSSQPTGVAGAYQQQRFVAPPFFSSPGMGFDMSTITNWLSASTTIGTLVVPNVALAGAGALLLFMFTGKKGRR